MSFLIFKIGDEHVFVTYIIWYVKGTDQENNYLDIDILIMHYYRHWQYMLIHTENITLLY